MRSDNGVGKELSRTGRARREDIIAAAIAVIGRDGYAVASIERIAQQAQTSKGTVLYHFGTKAAVCDAVVASLGENEYHASAIAVRDAATAQTVLDEIRKGGDFAALARQYSQGPNAAQGGQLNWVSFKTPITAGNTQNWPQPIAEALVKLPKGGVSAEPLKVGEQFWILRVDDRRATQIPKFEESAPLLRKQLEQVAMEKATAQMIGDLVKSARIQQ